MLCASPILCDPLIQHTLILYPRTVLLYRGIQFSFVFSLYYFIILPTWLRSFICTPTVNDIPIGCEFKTFRSHWLNETGDIWRQINERSHFVFGAFILQRQWLTLAHKFVCSRHKNWKIIRFASLFLNNLCCFEYLVSTASVANWNSWNLWSIWVKFFLFSSLALSIFWPLSTLECFIAVCILR